MPSHHELRSKRDYSSLREQLYALAYSDPAAAVRMATEFTVSGIFGPENLGVVGLRASLLVDAGVLARDHKAVERGVRIFRELVESRPNDEGLKYNLANGLLAHAKTLSVPSGTSWHLATLAGRLEARRLFHGVGLSRGEPSLRTQALTNLGNDLAASFRFVEAVDAYRRALAIEPTNGVAAGYCARHLLLMSRVGLGEPEHLVPLAGHYASIAKANRNVVAAYAGPKAVEDFDTLPEAPYKAPRRRARSAYRRFVDEHDLALVPTTEGLPSGMLFDTAHIPSVTQNVTAPDEPPVVFAMFNSIKQNFLMARWLAFQSQALREPHTAVYLDTGDGATYGQRASAIILAQRCALDVLDQVAVAANEHLALGVAVRDVSFRRLWKDNKGVRWRAQVATEIDAGNWALVALGELAEDLREGGFLDFAGSLRNASTHRCLVIHPRRIGKHRPSPSVEHHDGRAFFDKSMHTLRFTRAALMAFVQAIVLHEERKGEGPRISFDVPVLKSKRRR